MELGRSCHRGRVFLFVCFYIDRSFESCFVAYRGCIGRFVLYHMMSFLPPTCLNGNQLRYTGLCKILEDEMVFLLNMKWVLRSEGFCVRGAVAEAMPVWQGHTSLEQTVGLWGGAGSTGLESNGLEPTLTVPLQHHPPGSLSSAPVCGSSGLTHPLSASAAWFFLFLGGR